MEKKELTIAGKGIIGIVLVLLGFGGGKMLTTQQFENAYVCDVNLKLGIFNRLSDNRKSGYYTLDTGEEKYNVCRGGQWISLKEYAEMKGVNWLELINEETEQIHTRINSQKKELCSVGSGCVPLE